MPRFPCILPDFTVSWFSKIPARFALQMSRCKLCRGCARGLAAKACFRAPKDLVTHGFDPLTPTSLCRRRLLVLFLGSPSLANLAFHLRPPYLPLTRIFNLASLQFCQDQWPRLADIFAFHQAGQSAPMDEQMGHPHRQKQCNKQETYYIILYYILLLFVLFGHHSGILG